MKLTDPYAKKYYPKAILKGLEFYYELLDKINIKAYLERNFPFERKDVLTALDFLKSIPNDADTNNYSFSHPHLELALESIENFRQMSKDELWMSEVSVIGYLDHLLFTASNLMVLKFRYDIQVAIKDLSTNDKINYLIHNKYYYSQNSSSFPKHFVSEASKFCDNLIEKFKEVKLVEEPDTISEEVRDMIGRYLTLVDNNINGNNLISPLLRGDFELFISRLNVMLSIPSYFDIKTDDKERTFHVYLLGVLQGRIDGYKVTSNKESGVGRYDILLSPVENQNPGVIFEIKKIDASTYVDRELELALDQIENKRYNMDLISLGVKKILTVAIVFIGLNSHVKFRVQNV